MGDYKKLPKSGVTNQGGKGYTEDYRDRNPREIDAQGNINFDPDFQQDRSDMEMQMTKMGYDVGRLDLEEYQYENMYRDWNSTDALEVPDQIDPFEAESYEFTRWAVTDLAGQFYNQFLVSGVTSLMAAPAIAGSAITGSEEGGFWDTWISGTDSLAEMTSYQTSDKALTPLTKEVNANNFMGAFGQGLGFVADIFVGSHGMGTAAKMAKGYAALDKVAKAGKLQKSQRLGSFLTSQVLMQKILYDEGVANGLSRGDAARVALPTAALVSASEGAAFEMLGLTMSGKVMRANARSAFSNQIKALGKQGGKVNLGNMQQVANKTARSFGQKMKDGAAGFTQGAAIESTQEYAQQYIEDFGKWAYDTFASGKNSILNFSGKDKSRFNVDWKETHQKALMGAMIGGLVGGTLGGVGSAVRGIEGNTLFYHIKESVDNNKPGNVKRILNKVKKLKATGGIENATEVEQTIKDMVQFSQNTKGLNINSSVANYQLFQLSKLENEFQDKFGKEFKIDSKTHYLVANAYRINAKKAIMLNQAMQNEMQELIDNGKPLSKNRLKFEKKLSNYEKLFKQIQKNQVSEQGLVEEIIKLESPAVKKRREDIARQEEIINAQKEKDNISVNEQMQEFENNKPKKQFETLEFEDGTKGTKKALQNMESLQKEFNELEAGSDQVLYDKFVNKLENQYGMSINDFTKLNDGWVMNDLKGQYESGKFKKVKTKETTDTKAKEKAPKQENRVEELEKQIEEQKKIVAVLGPEAKVGDNSGYEANLKLKRLEKALEIEKQAIAAAERKEGSMPIFQDEKTDGQFYRDNQEEIENRAKEIRDGKKSNVKEDKINQIAEEMALFEKEDAISYEGKNKEDAKFYQENKEAIDKKAEEIRKVNPPKSGKTKEKTTEAKKEEEESKAERIAKRDKKLFEDTQEAPGIPGKPKLDNIINDGNVTTGVYVNENGDVDIVISSTGTNQNYVGFYRVYEDGKPTNKFTSKMQVVDGKGFGKMIENAQKQLPKKHQWLETKSVSKDGLRVWNKAKQKGYKEVVDENGNIVTNEVTLNQATKEGITGESTDYKDVVVSKSEADNIINELQEIYPGIETSTIKGGPGKVKIKIKLPVLEKSSQSKTDSKVEPKTTEEVDSKKTKPKSDEKVDTTEKENVEEKVVKKEEDEEEINEIFQKEVGTDEISEEENKKLEESQKSIAERKRKARKRRKKQKQFTRNKNRKRAKSNPKLFNKIVKHLETLFPNIPIERIREAAWKYGAEVTGVLDEGRMKINTDTAFQNTALHEGSHILKEILGDDHPLIKAGIEFIKDTQYFKDAQKLYPKESIEYQAEEALMEAIADNSLEKLKVKFEGSQLKKFVAWLKKFWNSVKRTIGLKKGKQSVDMLADMLAYSKAPIAQNFGLSENYTKHQRSIQHEEAVNSVQSSVSMARIDYLLDPTSKYDPEEGNNLRAIVYGDLAQELLYEQQNPNEDSIFDGLSSQMVNKIINEPTARGKFQKMYYALKVESPILFDLIENSVNSLQKKSIPKITDLEELIKVEIKGDQKINKSVRAIITGLIDGDGYLLDSDAVYQQIAKIADMSIDNESFMKNLQDSVSNNEISNKLDLVLSTMPENVQNGIVSEINSLTNIEYRSLIKQKQVDKNGVVINTIRQKIQNKDKTVDESVDRYLDNTKKLNIPGIKNLKNKLINDIKSKLHFGYQKKNKFFYDSKEFAEVFTGESLTDNEWMEVLDNMSKTKSGIQSLAYAFGSQKYGFGKTINDLSNNGLVKKDDISSYLRKIAEAKKGDTRASNFVNQKGNNVSATRMGYWVNQFNKLFTYDKGFKSLVNNSNLYKNNPIVKYWNKTGVKPEWFIHDAFENVGQTRAIEHNDGAQNDVKLNNLFYFTQNFGGQDFYYQSVGVTADRKHLTYFKVPKIKLEDMPKAYRERANLDERLLNEELKKGKKSLNELVKQYNNLTLNKAKIVNGNIKVVTPFELDNQSEINNQIDNLEKLLETTKDISSIKNQNGDIDIKELLKSYVYNESLNRSYLTDVYAGPAIQKKSVADVMKRMGGMNSGGKLINVPKPVHVFVIDTKGLSDSFSFNGSNFQKWIAEMSGPTDMVGVNVKDMLYQIGNEGQLDYYKMSTLGLEGLDGNPATADSHSLTEFTDPNDLLNKTSYNQIGNAILKIEEALGGDAFVKIIDSDTVKGDLSQYDVIDLNEFVSNPLSVTKRNTLKDFKNYRVAFNLTKDFSKIPLKDQTVLLSTQLSKILLNYDVTLEQIQDFENSLVNVLKESLEMTNDSSYSSSKVYKNITDVVTMLELITKNSEENTKSDLIELLDQMKYFNSAERKTEYFVGPFSYNISQLTNLGALSDMYTEFGQGLITQEVWDSNLKKNGLNQVMFDSLMKEDALNKFEKNEIVKKEVLVKQETNTEKQLNSFDHPNLKPLVEQFLASKLTKAGVRIDIPGVYAHMLPDTSGELKGYSENNMEPMDIAVPWSMFVQQQEGESSSSARARAQELLKNNPELFNVAVVRVPASGPVSSFAGRVKFFLDGKSNTGMVSKEFMEKSDADNDGDKIFIYRKDLNKDSEVINSDKNKAFEEVWKKINSSAMKKEAMEGDLDLEIIEDLLKKLNIYDESIFKLNNQDDFASLASNMSFGADAIGIWAIASKMLSVLSQSKEGLKENVNFGFENNQLVNKERKEFTNNALNDVARFLQAALDMGKNPIHISTGINQDTIAVATTLSLLDVKYEEILPFLNHPAIKGLISDINEVKTSYVDKTSFNVNKFLKDKIEEYDAPMGDISDTALEMLIARGGRKEIAISKHQEEGVFRTKKGNYYNVELVDSINGNEVFEFSVTTNPDLKNSENLKVIQKFAELQKIASDLQSLIPVLQLDNKLPNSGFQVKKTREVLQKITANDFSFTTENLAKRPLIQHYNKLIGLLNNAYESKFYINNQFFYDNAMVMATSIYGKDSALYKHEKVFEAQKDAIYQYWAQKQLMKNVQMPKVFIDNVVTEMETFINSINNTSSNNLFVTKPGSLGQEDFEAVLSDLKAAKDYDATFNELSKSKNEGVLELLNNIKNAQDIQLVAQNYAENEFIRHIRVADQNGEKVIVPTKSLNNIDINGLKIIQEDFNKLPIEIQDNIVSYAMMRFGIASKIGSISKMLPSGFSMSFLKRSNNFKNNGVNDYSKGNSNVNLLNANTALKMKNDLPKVSNQEGVKLQMNEYIKTKNGANVISNSDFVVIEDSVWMRKPEGNNEINFVDLTGMQAYVTNNYTALIQDKNLLEMSNQEIAEKANDIKLKCR